MGKLISCMHLSDGGLPGQPPPLNIFRWRPGLIWVLPSLALPSLLDSWSPSSQTADRAEVWRFWEIFWTQSQVLALLQGRWGQVAWCEFAGEAGVGSL